MANAVVPGKKKTLGELSLGQMTPSLRYFTKSTRATAQKQHYLVRNYLVLLCIRLSRFPTSSWSCSYSCPRPAQVLFLSCPCPSLTLLQPCLQFLTLSGPSDSDNLAESKMLAFVVMWCGSCGIGSCGCLLRRSGVQVYSYWMTGWWEADPGFRCCPVSI